MLRSCQDKASSLEEKIPSSTERAVIKLPYNENV